MEEKTTNQKVIFFDCYQTLVDTNLDKESQKVNEQKGWEVFVNLLSKNYGISISASDLVSFIDKRKADFYTGKDKAIHHHDLRAIVTDVLEKDLKYPLPSKTVSILIYEYRKVSRGYVKLHHPKVIEVLTALSEKYTLSIASYTQSSFTQLELEELGIAKYFSYFVFSSDIGFRKESIGFYKKCLEVVGKEPSDCVMVGDNYKEDVLIPSQLEINTIWLKNPGADLPVTEAKAVVNFEEFERLPEAADKILETN